MLIDPPDYCSLPPALIYDCEDLERENYKALLQLAGWMWVCKRHKKPLRTSIPELAGRWGIKERATYTRLQVLAARGYIHATYGQGTAIQIALGPRALNRHTPGEPATHNTQGEPGHTPGEPATHNTQGEPGHTPGEPAGGESRANSLHEIGVSCKQFARDTNNNTVVVVVDPSDLDPEQLQLLQTIIAAGVFEDVAAHLVADPWVTLARVTRWRELLEGDATVKSVGAVLAANLRAHREPPSPRPSDDTRRFIQGRYAEFVEW